MSRSLPSRSLAPIEASGPWGHMGLDWKPCSPHYPALTEAFVPAGPPNGCTFSSPALTPEEPQLVQEPLILTLEMGKLTMGRVERWVGALTHRACGLGGSPSVSVCPGPRAEWISAGCLWSEPHPARGRPASSLQVFQLDRAHFLPQDGFLLLLLCEGWAATDRQTPRWAATSPAWPSWDVPLRAWAGSLAPASGLIVGGLSLHWGI